MKNNEDFKQLVTDKYNSLKRNRDAKRKKALAFTSGLLFCVIVCSVFIGNGMFFKIFNPSDAEPLYDTPNEPQDNSDKLPENNENVSFDADIWVSEEAATSHEAPENNESYLDAETESSDALIEESFVVSGSEVIEPDVPILENNYEITPDGFTNISETVEMMTLLFGFTGGKGSDTPDILGPVTTHEALLKDSETKKGLAEFSLSIFKNTYQSGKNNVISPASAFYVLAMSANGAYGNTRSQLVDALCGTDLDRLNEFMLEYNALYGENTMYDTRLSGALWYDSDINVDKAFLQKNFYYYGMEAYKTVMQEKTALNSINGWISEKTDGIITNMLDSIDPEADMLITGTVYFEAHWGESLTLLEGKHNFNTADGSVKKVEMMIGEGSKYLENSFCYGFAYDYTEKYRFIALLPQNGYEINDLINRLDANTYYDLLNDSQITKTSFLMPKFEHSTEYNLTDALLSIGIKDALDSKKADFSRMSDSDLYISNVIQNVTVSVHEKGTLSAGSTIITAPIERPDNVSKYVALDTPFLYLIVDNTTDLPIIIGTVEDFE